MLNPHVYVPLSERLALLITKTCFSVKSGRKVALRTGRPFLNQYIGIVLFDGVQFSVILDPNC